jgi:ABC-type transport system involved in multi-copper enzyme maturation permease subunit
VSIPRCLPILAVARFQLRRLLTPPRLALAAIGVAFPAVILLAVRRIEPGLDRNIAVALLYAIVPEAVCMLGLLLTTCSVVMDELERGTWPHLAVRPHGRRSLLLGTYLAAVTWTSAVGCLAVVAGVAAAGMERPAPVVATLSALVLLSCVGRGALFMLPGVILPRRALVASVAVALVVEYLVGFLPAVVNQATVALRLRSLLVSWMGWRQQLPVESRLFIDSGPPWLQVTAVLVLAAVLLAVSLQVLERRQFPPSEQV